MGNACKRQVRWVVFFPQCLMMVWGFHKLFLEKVSLICGSTMIIQMSFIWCSLIAKTEPDPWSWANRLKKKSLEYVSLGYLNLFAVLRQFCWYHCTGVSGTHLLPRDGPKQDYFFHEHLTNGGQESWAQNVPGLGFGFVRPSGQGLPSVVQCSTGPPAISLLLLSLSV